ncbi:MAG TPA: hypothetical protein VJQ52_08475 [Steroidobacteraceae bacterium]|nr:hypothetical protein [Steroidobacteraceae bacterium]
MNDELKKLGLRIRPRVVAPRQQAPGAPGQIAFDARGNAVYEWRDGRLTEDGAAGERARENALANPGLAIVDDDAPANAPIRSNPKGLRVGYNPYESGLLARKAVRKKPDLRELSRWMEAKRNAKLDGQEE